MLANRHASLQDGLSWTCLMISLKLIGGFSRVEIVSGLCLEFLARNWDQGVDGFATVLQSFVSGEAESSSSLLSIIEMSPRLTRHVLSSRLHGQESYLDEGWPPRYGWTVQTGPRIGRSLRR
jgi:hypothetical protein